MRPILTLLALVLLAGCTAPSTEDAAVVQAGPVETPAPFHLEGRLWLPPSAPMRPAMTELPVELEENVSNFTATIHLGSTVAPAAGAASAMVELRDAAGNTIAGAMIMPRGSPEATFEAKDLPAGDYVLWFETTGASDGRSAGQYLDYVADAA